MMHPLAQEINKGGCKMTRRTLKTGPSHSTFLISVCNIYHPLQQVVCRVVRGAVTNGEAEAGENWGGENKENLCHHASISHLTWPAPGQLPSSSPAAARAITQSQEDSRTVQTTDCPVSYLLQTGPLD